MTRAVGEGQRTAAARKRMSTRSLDLRPDSVMAKGCGLVEEKTVEEACAERVWGGMGG